MSERSDFEKLTEHEYDGIREYDNPTPGWMHLLFIGTVVFSVFYAAFWHFSEFAWDIHESYESEVASYYAILFQDVGDLKPNEETILRVMHDPDMTQFRPVAQAVFAGKCASCHGAAGQGGTGPNLTDESYLNVRSLEEVAAVIADGAKNGAMPSWRGKLHPNQIVLLAGYVASMRGQDLPGKAPEGEAIAPWPTPDGNE